MLYAHHGSTVSSSLDWTGPQVPTEHRYRIVFGGEFNDAAREALDGWKIEPVGADTALIADVDQAALHGVLNRVHCLGLYLVEARRRPSSHANTGGPSRLVRDSRAAPGHTLNGGRKPGPGGRPVDSASAGAPAITDTRQAAERAVQWARSVCAFPRFGAVRSRAIASGRERSARLTNTAAGYYESMATERQKRAARQNIKKARAAQSARAHGEKVPRRSEGMSTAEQNRLDDERFAFPDERKMPIHDAKHVRNAVARFDQVEGVSDAERDHAWKRIKSAAKKYDVDLSEDDWRELFTRGKVRR
jgi:hypothetical protein